MKSNAYTMTAAVFLQSTTKNLQAAGIESARLDCLILLEDATGKDRSWLLAHPEFELRKSVVASLTAALERRAQQEPLAYIRGKVEFYGREFYVDHSVLVPRPESENFIELLKNSKLNKKGTRILDLGTGSGCIGITLALELPDAKVTLADIDQPALAVAQENATLLKATVSIITSDLLGTISAQFDSIVTNLPYVPDNYPTNLPVSFEPKLALYAGSDGLDLYRMFWQQVGQLTTKPELILTESLAEQHETLAKLAISANYRLAEISGLSCSFLHSSDLVAVSIGRGQCD